MPGTIAEELLRILAAKKASGKTCAWISPQNAQAFFYGTPTRQPQQPVLQSQPHPSPSKPVAKPRPIVQPQPVAQPPAPKPEPVKVVPTGLVANHDWAELEAAALACKACPLYAGRKNLTFGCGCRQSKLMFIGEGPGEEEDRQGKPFVGRAGQLLTKMIAAMGLDRESQDPEKGCYIANIIKCRPPGNRNPNLEEGNACIQFLHRQIQLVNPKAIVLLGAVPLNFLMGKRGITQARGNWLEYNGIPVMPTFHPAYLLRFEKSQERFVQEKRKVWSDLQQVMALLNLKRPQTI